MNLKKFDLDFKKTLSYFYDNLQGTNSLCDCTLKHLEKGSFYTYLPETTSEKDLYSFKSGGIAQGVFLNHPTFLLNLLKTKKSASYIFDAACMTYNEKLTDLLFQNYGRYINDEVYFLISKKDASLERIKQCTYHSNAIWHSLCILINLDIENKPNTKISEDELESIGENMEMIFLLAYDAEGYVTWEKNGRSIQLP